ncbi:MAG: copper amine oxidase N-terminal domain-containing protein [Oscillospiraceae bacterium]|nr:copper amine oxidase N-terminal domain-containing protein [Oscillospiraceae bacterium]
MKIKKCLILIFAGLLFTAVLGFTPVSAENKTTDATLHYRDIRITLDGTVVTPTDEHGNYTEPFIMDGSTYLPVRGLAALLGLSVEWEGSTSTISLAKQSSGKSAEPVYTLGSVETVAVTLTYRDIIILLDGKEINATDERGNTVEPFIMGNTTYLPMRGMASALGLSVSWDGVTGTVILSEDGKNDETREQNIKTLSIGAELSGYFGEHEEGKPKTEDWYRIFLPSGGKLSLFANAEDGMYINMYLYASDEVTAITAKGGRNETVGIIEFFESGTYYLCIRCYYTGSYTLSSEFEETEMRNDPKGNDSGSTAGPLAPDSTVTGYLGFFNDTGKTDTEDWYRISISEPCSITFTLVAEHGMFVNLFLYSGDETSRITEAGDINRPISVSAQLRQGTYLLLVRSYYLGGYTLSCTVS